MAFKIPGYTNGSFNHLVLVGTFYPAINGVLDTAVKRIGFLFMASVSQNSTGFLYGSAANGGTVTNIARADLYAVDDNGAPTGASLANATFTPTASALNTVTWDTPAAVTAGTCYAIVLQNLDGTPATNKFSVTHTNTGNYPWADIVCGNNLLIASNDSGTTWNSWGSNQPVHLCGSMGAAPTYDSLGTDSSAILVLGGSGNMPTSLYNAAGSRTARAAIKWNCPKTVLLWGFTESFAGKVSTPTFNLMGEVCSASASLSTSSNLVNAASANSVRQMFWWSTPYRLLANTDYYIGATPSEVGDGSASKYCIASGYPPLLKTPTVGPIYGSYESTNSGTPSWSQSTSLMPNIRLFLEMPTMGGFTVLGP